MQRVSPKERRVALAGAQQDIDLKSQQAELAQQQNQFAQLLGLYGLDEKSQRLPGELAAQDAQTAAATGAADRLALLAPAELAGMQAGTAATVGNTARASQLFPEQLHGLQLANAHQAVETGLATGKGTQELAANIPGVQAETGRAQADALKMSTKLAPIQAGQQNYINAGVLPPAFLEDTLTSLMPEVAQVGAKRAKERAGHASGSERGKAVQAFLAADRYNPGVGATLGITEAQWRAIKASQQYETPPVANFQHTGVPF